jgi:hypothetical protein
MRWLRRSCAVAAILGLGFVILALGAVAQDDDGPDTRRSSCSTDGPRSPRGVQKLDRHVTSAWRSGLRQCGPVIRSLLYLLLRRVLGLVHSEDRAAAEADIELAVLRHRSRSFAGR